MTEETLENPEIENEADQAAAATDSAPAADDAAVDDAAAGEVESQTGPSAPDFAELQRHPNSGGQPAELKRLNEVQVTVAAELGRTRVPISELLQLTEGAVFELNRSIGSPVELLAQGVPLGNGEVVVVDDSFAIRIQEIYSTR